MTAGAPLRRFACRQAGQRRPCRRHRRRRVRRLDRRASAPQRAPSDAGRHGGAANSRASSGGESRMTRGGYGKDEIYTRMALDSCRSGRPVRTLGPADLHPERRTVLLPAARRPISTTRCGAPAAGLPIELLDCRAAAPLPDDRFQRRRGGPVRAGLRRADGPPRGADPGRRICRDRRRVSPRAALPPARSGR